MKSKTLDDLVKEYPWIGKNGIEIVKMRVWRVINEAIETAEKNRKASIKIKDSFSAGCHRGSMYALESLKKELGL